MTMLMVLATSVSGAPTQTFLPAPYLPETWMQVTYLVVLYVVVPVWMSVHAWIFLHQRKHNMPPYLVLRLYQWWRGAKPGRSLIGMGSRHRKANGV